MKTFRDFVESVDTAPGLSTEQELNEVLKNTDKTITALVTDGSLYLTVKGSFTPEGLKYKTGRANVGGGMPLPLYNKFSEDEMAELVKQWPAILDKAAAFDRKKASELNSHIKSFYKDIEKFAEKYGKEYFKFIESEANKAVGK